MKIICLNKRATFDYIITDKIEAGIVLTGEEVKSIRAKNVSLLDAYATVYKGEIMLLNCYIAPYSHAYNAKNREDDSRKSRKLLFHKKEINKLIGDVSRKGITLIPLKMYFSKRGLIKVEIGLAKHKNVADKRRTIKDRDLNREMRRELKTY